MTPRAPVYLAFTEDVARSVAALDVAYGRDRVGAVEQIISGEPRPLSLPVLLVSRRNVARAPGFYELDELRRTEAVVGRLADRALATGTEPARDDLVVVAPGAHTPESVSSQTTGVITESRVAEPRVIPQGAFPLVDLAVVLARADRDESAIFDAIKSCPTAGPIVSPGTLEPWRVVITCPVPEGDPAVLHRVLFTGDGGDEPPLVTGVPAGGIDEALETSAEMDLYPAHAVSRLERRNTALLVGELAVIAVALALGWASGALAFAVRETPVWFTFAVVMAAVALVFAIVPRFAANATDRNPDDTLEVGRFYGSRLELLTIAPSVSAGAFALALLCAIAPPALVGSIELGPPTVTFDVARSAVTMRVQLTADGVGTDDQVAVELREFGDADAVGTPIGHLSSSGNASGTVAFDTTTSLRSTARFVSIVAWTPGDDGSATAPTCTPAAPSALGCTVVAVPPLGAGVIAEGASTTTTATAGTTVVVPSAVTTSTTSPSVTSSSSASTVPPTSP